MSSIRKFNYVVVPLDKITPIYIETTSKKGLEKRLKIIDQKRFLSLVMIVEKVPNQEKWYLIAGYPEYEAYVEFNHRQQNESSSIKEISCFVRPLTNHTEQRIVLLERMFTHQFTKWTDKYHVVSELVDSGKSINEIAKKLNVEKEDVKKFFIHPDIPAPIVEEALINEGSLLTLDNIRRVNLNPLLKTRLYHFAVKPKKDLQRLTLEKMQKIKWLLKLDSFYDLTNFEQWNMVIEAFYYRWFLESSWQTKIYHLRELDPPPTDPIEEEPSFLQ